MEEHIERLIASQCPSDLRKTGGGYSTMARKALFEGELINPIQQLNLPNSSTGSDSATRQLRHLSLSGVQEKYGLTQNLRNFHLTEKDERSTHILKPIVSSTHVKRPEWMPANEHLSMQLAAQVFDIRTAPNGLIFSADLLPAYITSRFDRKTDGTKWAVEDFAALAGRTAATHGENYKYLGSYLEVFAVLQKHVAAYPIEAGKLFKLLVFNYLIGNGDAHFRNFSLIETRWGDYILAPAYDLLYTGMHIEDTPFALSDELLPANQRSGSVQQQFRVLAREVDLPVKFVDRLFAQIPTYSDSVKDLVARSFLPPKAQRQYLQNYQQRLNRLMKM